MSSASTSCMEAMQRGSACWAVRIVLSTGWDWEDGRRDNVNVRRCLISYKVYGLLLYTKLKEKAPKASLHGAPHEGPSSSQDCWFQKGSRIH